MPVPTRHHITACHSPARLQLRLPVDSGLPCSKAQSPESAKEWPLPLSVFWLNPLKTTHSLTATDRHGQGRVVQSVLGVHLLDDKYITPPHTGQRPTRPQWLNRILSWDRPISRTVYTLCFLHDRARPLWRPLPKYPSRTGCRSRPSVRGP